MCRDCDSVPIHRLLRANATLAEIEGEIDNGNVNLRSPCGKSPLMTAAYVCHKAALQLLIDRGAVVNAIHEKSGDTPAHFVTLSLSGHIRQCACVMVLIENGANIEMRNTDGYTVFQLATKNGNMDIGNTGSALMRPEADDLLRN